MASSDVPKLVLLMFAIYGLAIAIVGPSVPGLISRRLLEMPREIGAPKIRRARWLGAVSGVLCLGLLGSLVGIDHYLAHRAAERHARAMQNG